jgi:hypothetical protein
MYHEPLLIAIALSMFSWYFLLQAFEAASTSRRHYLFALSGLLLGGAIATRLTYLGYIVGPGIILFWVAVSKAEARSSLADLMAFGAPLALFGLILAFYNFARFGSMFEFGLSYQLVGSEQLYDMSVRGAGPLVRRAVDPNVALLYLLSVPRLDTHFPFFPFAGNGIVFPPAAWDNGLWVELPVVSPFVLAPVSLLTAIAPVAIVKRAMPHGLGLFLVSMMVGIGATLFLLSSFPFITARYIADILPGLTLCGSTLLVWVAARPGLATSRIAAPVCMAWAVSIAAGLALGWGAWQYSFPEQAGLAGANLNRTVDSASWAVWSAAIPFSRSARLLDRPSPEQLVVDARKNVSALRSAVETLRFQAAAQSTGVGVQGQQAIVASDHSRADELHLDADRMQREADTLHAQADAAAGPDKGLLLLVEANRLVIEANLLHSEIDLLGDEIKHRDDQ